MTNAILRAITLALALCAVGIVNPCSAREADDRTLPPPAACNTSYYSLLAWIEGGECSGALEADRRLLSATTAKAAHNQDSILDLGVKLRRARAAINSKADKSVVEAIERRVTELEARLRTSCASITEAAAAAPCWLVLKQATGDTNMAAIGTFGTALIAGRQFKGTVAVGATDVTPGFFMHIEPQPEPAPAFAKSRRDTPRPVAETEPLGFLVPVLGGCAIGAAGGWGLADGLEVNFDDDTLDEGKGGKGAAVGCAIGAAGGAFFTWAYNSSLGDDD